MAFGRDRDVKDSERCITVRRTQVGNGTPSNIATAQITHMCDALETMASAPFDCLLRMSGRGRDE